MLLVRSEIARLQMREGQESVVTGHLLPWLSPGDHRAAGDVHITNTRTLSTIVMRGHLFADITLYA